LLSFVPTPIRNLEDISLRSLKLLESADIIFCEDTRVTKRLISLLIQRNNINPQIDRYISLHSHNEKEVLKDLAPDIFEQNVLYLSDAGMPVVSDPGCALVNYCHKNGIKYDVLPGANAALLAYASSGFCDTKFLFFGFLPHKGGDRQNALDQALYNGFVTIVYESPHRILKLVQQISEIEPDRELFLIKEATKLHQRTFKGSAAQINESFGDQNLKGEWVVVISSADKKIGYVTVGDILSLDIPKKQASKLIAKITGKSPKECYNEIIEQN
jgi:16S rRNA (cytidine1402-2'-O)-methyltransferase